MLVEYLFPMFFLGDIYSVCKDTSFYLFGKNLKVNNVSFVVYCCCICGYASDDEC